MDAEVVRLINRLNALEAIVLGARGNGSGISSAADIPDNSITNAKLADMAAWTVKVRNAASSGDPSDAALADFTTLATPVTGDFVVGFKSTGELRKIDVGTISTVNSGAGTPGARTVPGGRLTNSSGVPVPVASVTGAATMYYAPYATDLVPIYDGTQWVVYSFSEISQALNNTTKQPAAIGSFAVADAFIWNDSSTLRMAFVSWSRAQTFTVTIATPAVVSITGHGYYEGMPWVPTTSGALPTGMTAGTTYFVISTGLTANAFQFSATVGGAAVNTSGSQSGVHTATDKVTSTARGTGAGTAELQLLSGLWTNKNAITNGPAANRGTYIGTVVTNTSSQVDMILGTTGTDGGESTFLGVWNVYNRRLMKLNNYDTTNTWNYTTASYRVKGGNMNNRIGFVIGLAEDLVQGHNYTMSLNASTNVQRVASVAFNATTKWNPGQSITIYDGLGSGELRFIAGAWSGVPTIGSGYLAPLELSGATGTTTWYGDNNDAGAGTGSVASMFWANIFA